MLADLLGSRSYCSTCSLLYFCNSGRVQVDQPHSQNSGGMFLCAVGADSDRLLHSNLHWPGRPQHHWRTNPPQRNIKKAMLYLPFIGKEIDLALPKLSKMHIADGPSQPTGKQLHKSEQYNQLHPSEHNLLHRNGYDVQHLLGCLSHPA